MTHVLMIARGGHLEPAEDEAAALMRKIVDGTEMVVDVHPPQDGKWLKKWWKMMSIVAENMPDAFADRRAVSDMVLIAVHAADVRINPKTGSMTPVPHSLANMDQDVRDRVWERAVYYITSQWIPIASEQLEAEVDGFFSGDRQASLGRRVRRFA